MLKVPEVSGHEREVVLDSVGGDEDIGIADDLTGATQLPANSGEALHDLVISLIAGCFPASQSATQSLSIRKFIVRRGDGRSAYGFRRCQQSAYPYRRCLSSYPQRLGKLRSRVSS